MLAIVFKGFEKLFLEGAVLHSVVRSDSFEWLLNDWTLSSGHSTQALAGVWKRKN